VLRRTRRVRPLLALQAALAVGVVALAAAGLAFPSLVPAVPKARSEAAFALLAAGLLFCSILVHRATRTHWLTRRPADLLVAVGCVWLGVALVATLVIGPMTLGYYVGHGLELAAVAMIAIPAARDIARTGSSLPLVGDLTTADLVAAEEAYLGPRVRALTLTLAARDGSTEEHSRRVAVLAAQVGEELRLPATSRRHLAVGGLLHDIGKLSVLLEIRGKPAGLTDAEYMAVKRHPEAGRRLLDELGGFSPTVRDLVFDHHERLDGNGYPRGLSEEDLRPRVPGRLDAGARVRAAALRRRDRVRRALRRGAGQGPRPRGVRSRVGRGRRSRCRRASRRGDPGPATQQMTCRWNGVGPAFCAKSTRTLAGTPPAATDGLGLSAFSPPVAVAP